MLPFAETCQLIIPQVEIVRTESQAIADRLRALEVARERAFEDEVLGAQPIADEPRENADVGHVGEQAERSGAVQEPSGVRAEVGPSLKVAWKKPMENLALRE